MDPALKARAEIVTTLAGTKQMANAQSAVMAIPRGGEIAVAMALLWAAATFAARVRLIVRSGAADAANDDAALVAEAKAALRELADFGFAEDAGIARPTGTVLQ